MELEYITEKNTPTKEEIMQYMKLPLVLFQDAEYKETLSLPAKVLYCFLLDRSGLSIMNAESFTDSSGRAFVFYSWDEAMDMLQCGRQKVSKVFKELEKSGLIERKSRGLGKSPKIFVKKFKNEIYAKEEICESVTAMESSDKYENHTHEYENHTCYIESDLPEQDLPCLNLSSEKIDECNKDQISYEACLNRAEQQIAEKKNLEADYSALIMDIDDSVSESKQKLQQDRQELAAVMAWAYATQKPALKIGGINVSIKTVRKKLSCITANHASKILHNLGKCQSRIRNRRNYLLTCLFHEADNPDIFRSKTRNASVYESFVYNLN